ncbi:UvrD-helicase domain-containing protein [Rhodococcus sp. IEGM 1366]|uniref:UvrD-helicase domain-containing protein n=1 Tax=Rhodococcus sp. IEGM 1366 TaxID=3082223 RepID=UPI0029556EC8|nr:UvrD-helicase domain-containing protein [Rhodococcus sp. IEGM 1366]MDV8071163.1 UvrD-helicase domain-containing protein [Rhodococcus sp. IEGM 1366]
MAIRLTDRQVIAAASDRPFTNIVSAPGSGKTTVAAERFGYLAFQRAADRRGVLGLSFNRAAVAELGSRITARWGKPTIQLPNMVTTFDDLHVRLMHHLIDRGHIRWPGDHSSVEVLDDYRGKPGFRFLGATSWKRIAICDEFGKVVSSSLQLATPKDGIGVAANHRTVLAEGLASHEDVRSILRSAIPLDGVVDAIERWIGSNFRHIIVDEIYDADVLDLWMLGKAGSVETHLTLVGDPWQALYEWRGATPEKVQTLIDGFPFHQYEQPESFRFRGEQMPELARTLRTGAAVTIPRRTSDVVDVALARRWVDLWNVGDNVLPLAFRSVGNAIDGMLNLLLDEVSRRKLGRDSFGKQAACVILGIDPGELALVQASVLNPVLQAMHNGASADRVLNLLRDVALNLGAKRRPSRLPGQGEPDRRSEVEALSRRLRRDDLILGLTVHQAKGREWPRVGVALSAKDEQRLAAGLHKLEPEDCVLYVALTRAREECVSLGDMRQLQLTDK